jgi:hypothetical protein
VISTNGKVIIDGYANGDIWMHGGKPDSKAIINLAVSSTAWDNDVNNNSENIKSILLQMVDFLDKSIEDEKQSKRSQTIKKRKFGVIIPIK